jgi:hypothetical protein
MGNHLATAATIRYSVVTCEAYRTWSIRQINTRTIRRSGENNGIDAVVASPFPHREIGVFYLVIPAGMLRCHEVHDQVHENRAECLFSLLKPYLRVFRGISKLNLPG